MGTLLYARGVFINQCFDALNLSDPDRVLAVHQEYVEAGADVIETNTFGANRIKLRGFGLADSLHEINVGGARLARAAAGDRAYVAGAIGPLGVRIEPWGKTGRDEAEVHFGEQARALVDGSVDLFMLETFRDVNELQAAIAAVRRLSSLPVVAQMTIEEDGHSLDGTPLDQFVPALEASGADVIGLNCRVGPAHMLETIERMAALTRARLSAQPNAGQPREIEGRTIYLTSPEYMASYARRFVAMGVRLVGGCCGTTPAHIREIRRAVDRLSGSGVAAMPAAEVRPGRDDVAPGPAVVPVSRAEKSSFAHALARGRFVTVVELLPPRGHAAAEVIESAELLRIGGVDAVQVAEPVGGARMSALALAVVIRQHTGIETVLQYSTRDRHLLEIQSDCLGAHAMGIRNILAVTGAVRAVGDFPDASEVTDVDSIGLVNLVARLNHGRDIGGQWIGEPSAFHVGVTVNPAAEDLDDEIRRFQYKVEAGAEFVITRPVFDIAAFERLHARIEGAGIPIVLGLLPIESAREAEFMANELPGTGIPASVIGRLRSAATPDHAAAEGVAIACEIGQALRGLVQGVHVPAIVGRVTTALAIVDGLRS